MAANYWDSTQAKHFTYTKSELASLRLALHPNTTNNTNTTGPPFPETRHLAIYTLTNLTKFARRQTNIRQQALATAQIYLKRFHLSVDVRKTNPYLLMATALYLACKMEETPLHIRLMLSEASRHWTELGVSETARLGECEFALISTLRSRLILHHPYRALGELQGVFGLGVEEQALAHSIINDSYATDLALLYPPHIIAITAIFLAVVLRPAGGLPAGLAAHAASPAVGSAAAQSALAGFGGLKQSGPKLAKLVDWLAESKVDMEAIVDATQEMVSLYECWEGYNEKAVREAFAKMLKDMK
ncbi:RNA polymerase II holoenzyme cyclin-like subunit [Friedmanniomyces endolithicus]|uniref:RNA polymerase II holoenzyme cyclin-like subunit n=2 Tax=Dothideomycetidae TaxID=451867 RepID=A0ABR0L6D2_9PEZI|nr:RNA polymerase II holoenzyme cyclin-like subunit [Friedmanniomyces endolithicus]KAK5143610.1 RNA polymerase II holoenzyme cyclin-like subunit [Rachicladosporium monterosium]KAK0783736.1 RNA polymerase II holoenzyme cyclin-like subunit [Friedmanniomyces endolithicus]KAK0796427.1 RNA polymerase II holoenzyme cyclin-like subunit [Friedmanniomyces endolithicus]KAK0797781.1 RNA polymerase II holoenzyme cyclin-like subunit [Friedmanniomyces endolithicus]